MPTSGFETRPSSNIWSKAVASSRASIPYLLVGGTTLLLAAIVLQIWTANARVPFYYASGGDVLGALSVFKLIAETGWVDQSDRLGMPFGAEFYNYPSTSGLHEVAIWLLHLPVHDPIIALNTYYLLCFPLTSISALYVFRRFDISQPAAGSAAVLFSFLPYRFFRNEAHLFYASYFFVPLAVMVMLWISRSDNLFIFSRESLRRPVRSVTRRGWAALAICLCLASDNPYHTFFFVFFLIIAGAIAFARTWSVIASVCPAAILVVTVAAGFALNLTPTWIYNSTHSELGSAFHRIPSDAQKYSITLAQLLLPIQKHRIAPLAALRADYDNGSLADVVNENSSASLGFAGAAGFIFLAAWLVLRPNIRKPSVLLDDLASLNATAFLLATFGGVGTLIAFYVSDVVHAYARITPFIAFFSLFVFAILFDRVLRVLLMKQGSRLVIAVASVIVVSLGVLDQTSAATVPPYASAALKYSAMQRFIDAVEASVPTGASIFELPVIAFPEEYVRYARILPSEELLPFVHSKTLRWTYGSFADSDSNRFAISASSETPQRMAFTLALAGFDGVLIDRNGYDDAAADLERGLRSVAGRQPLISENGQWAFLNLTNYRTAVKERLGPERFSRGQVLARYPLALEWRSGCSYPESLPGRVWRWCGHRAELAISNRSAMRRSMHMSMTIITGFSTKSSVAIDTSAGSTTVAASQRGAPYAVDVDLPPQSTSVVSLHSDARALQAAGDPRSLVFQIVNLAYDENNGVDVLLNESGESSR